MNYTLQDTLAVVRATAAFSLMLYFPGYLLGLALDLAGFRASSLAARSAWAIGLSFAIVPFCLANIPLPVGAWAIILCVAAAASLWSMRGRGGLARADLVVLAVTATGAILVGLELVDLDTGTGLYLNVATLDQQYRVAFTEALTRSMVHPVNPLYHPGHAVALRYYYFWYGLCALCTRLAHVGARPALIASSIWCGTGLAAVSALGLRYFFQVRHALRRQVLSAVCLLGVTGADLLPVTANFATGEPYAGDPEWWSTDQVTSWFDSVLWVPHHTAALLCCVMAFLLLWQLRRPGRWQTQAVLAGVAAIAAASAFGLSVYVTLGFAILMLCWIAQLCWQGSRRMAAIVAGTGGLTALLLIPFVRSLLRAVSGTQAGSATGAGHLLQFGFRKIIDSSLITGLPVFAAANVRHAVLVDQIVRLLLLVPGWGLELGFWALVLWWTWRARRSLDEARRTALLLTLCGLVLVSVVRSAVIQNNDFGYRAALLPCFFLLLLGTDLVATLAQRSPAVRRLALGLIALGAAGTLFQAVSLRFYLPIVAYRQPAMRGLGEVLLDRRKTLETAATLLPPDAILQADETDSQSYSLVANILYGKHAMATDAAGDCGAVFGGDPSRCAILRTSMRTLYTLPGQPRPAAAAFCARWGIDALIAVDTDPAWHDPNSWVWTSPQIATGQNSRIVRCR